MTRAGLALYGYALPLQGGEPHLQPRLQPALAWKTRVDQPARGSRRGHRWLQRRLCRTAGTCGWRCCRWAMRTAIAVGLSSSNSTPGADVLLHGRRAPVVGRVSMDLTIVDVTAIPETAIGDEAVLLGDRRRRAHGSRRTRAAGRHQHLRGAVRHQRPRAARRGGVTAAFLPVRFRTANRLLPKRELQNGTPRESQRNLRSGGTVSRGESRGLPAPHQPSRERGYGPGGG